MEKIIQIATSDLVVLFLTNDMDKEEEKDSTDNCYLTYSDELEGGGYLICSYNHQIGEECLMDEKEQ